MQSENPRPWQTGGNTPDNDEPGQDPEDSAEVIGNEPTARDGVVPGVPGNSRAPRPDDSGARTVPAGQSESPLAGDGDGERPGPTAPATSSDAGSPTPPSPGIPSEPREDLPPTGTAASRFDGSGRSITPGAYPPVTAPRDTGDGTDTQGRPAPSAPGDSPGEVPATPVYGSPGEAQSLAGFGGEAVAREASGGAVVRNGPGSGELNPSPFARPAGDVKEAPTRPERGDPSTGLLELGDSEEMLCEVDSGDEGRFLLTNQRVIFQARHSDGALFSASAVGDVTAIEFGRRRREARSAWWGVIGLLAAIAVWQVTANETIGAVAGAVVGAISALLLADYWFRPPGLVLRFGTAGGSVEGPVSGKRAREAEVMAARLQRLQRMGAPRGREARPAPPGGSPGL